MTGFKLSKHIIDIVYSLQNLDYICQYLYQFDHLTKCNIDFILSQSYKRNSSFFWFLERRARLSPGILHDFFQALENTCQFVLLHKLDDAAGSEDV